ncbi:MAG: phospholipase [Bacteroidia bacterium]|nr:phospholipase [Bacteroidia bacterium]
MQKHFFSVTKTARYFTHGKLDNNTKYIWIIIHGYAQTADAFLSNFENLGSEHFVVAPEGLNKFYSRGFSGSPVASWMTSLEREQEILDYTNYLNSLVNSLNLVSFTQAKTIVLGFSQGVSTQTRFIASSDVKFDYSVMIAGEIGKEFQENLPEKLANLKSLYLVGDQENILKSEKIESHQMLFKNANCTFKIFEGKHVVNQDTIDKIIDFVIE